MKNTTLQREPLYRQIYQLLEKQILTNELSVGDVIPAEQTLADNLQVHRSSIREALRLLEENGLVERKLGGKKLTVRSPDRNRLCIRISNTLILEEVTFNEIYEAIRIMDAEVAVLAAEKISPTLLEKIAENLRQTEINLEDNDALLELDFEFHNLVIEATCNRVLQLNRLGMKQLYYPAVNRLIKTTKVRHRLLEAHRQIYEGLKNHDPEHTKAWVLKHTDDFKRGFEVAGLDLNSPVQFLPEDAP